MGKKIRRVVTGHDKNGVATVIMDGEASCILHRPNCPGVTPTNLWQTDISPADIERHDDPVTGPLILHPPKTGSVFRIVQSTQKTQNSLQRWMARRRLPKWVQVPILSTGRASIYAPDWQFGLWGGADWRNLHDDGQDEYLLKAGDVVVQQGTNHAWSNRGSEPCRLLSSWLTQSNIQPDCFGDSTNPNLAWWIHFIVKITNEPTMHGQTIACPIYE